MALPLGKKIHLQRRHARTPTPHVLVVLAARNAKIPTQEKRIAKQKVILAQQNAMY
jgi:hypothetical protein